MQTTTELGFENELIKHLQRISTSKQWEYVPEIKTTAHLWENFKIILETLNQDVLDRPLSDAEFSQVQQVVNQLHTPYAAGKFLYGMNGKSQVEVDLDDERHVFLTVFDQSQIGAGNTVYQVVNQIERPAVQAGRPNRRFDVTLLINGLPIIQIEEKKSHHSVNEALNQMQQYIVEGQYRDIFSTLQILVAMTPTEIRYMANTTADKFNRSFAFTWQDEKTNRVVRDWKAFTKSMLSIPMAHQMATNYMILDGARQQQMLKVMRPYQVYATQRVLEKVKQHDFSLTSRDNQKLGYVWHTTGSGKTISSFKAAWLASQLPNVDKVVFVVDRIALTNQTTENYRAYDPENDANEKNINGIVNDTANVTDLWKKLKSSQRSITVTSVQKLARLVKRQGMKEKIKASKKRILFIVDEAHRSTGGTSFEEIQAAFPHGAWVGYTGTPMFDQTTKGPRTQDVFGDLLHAYTIREAIADRNVLGFQVDFQSTLAENEIRDRYLPQFYHIQHPTWSDEKIQTKIDDLQPEDMDDEISPSFYDENKQHVALVVADILKNWRNRSADGQYNAMLTTHVGGNRASTPMAMMYYDEFQKQNAQRVDQGQTPLKVAVTFSANTTNQDGMVEQNQALLKAIKDYNSLFGTSFGLDTVSDYTADVTSRLNRSAADQHYLDLVIVVDQLLTGFDAPQMNTLYVDRTLKGAGLIQAYSRTNRIADRTTKPFGHIVNYRWPKHNEELMNDALSIYANRDSADGEKGKTDTGPNPVIVKSFPEVLRETQDVVEDLVKLTENFTRVPDDMGKQDEMLHKLRVYNRHVTQLKQYSPSDTGEDGFDYDNPEQLLTQLGMTAEQEQVLTTSLAQELKDLIAQRINPMDAVDLDLELTHIKDIEINYSYLTELIANYMNQVHAADQQGAKQTAKQITDMTDKMTDQQYAKKIQTFLRAVKDGDVVSDDYPVKPDQSDYYIEQAHYKAIDRQLVDFRYAWGLTEDITSEAMREWLLGHQPGEDDLDKMGILSTLIAAGAKHYQDFAHEPSVLKLSKIRYRNQLREAIRQLADQLNEEN